MTVNWNERYRQRDTPWNLEKPALAFEKLAQGGWSLNDHVYALPAGAKLWLPGCGLGHDAAVFGDRGYDVIGVDLAPLAIASADERYGHLAQFQLQDGLHPAKSHHGQFDAVMEHTFFCAIDPACRKAYARAVAAVLKPGGKLFGIFWLHQQAGGPPFDVTRHELKDLFLDAFDWLAFEPNPWPMPARKPQEWLLVLSKK
ncbi:MAG: methyltransferase domain-containing protein [Vampirovibrionales bacterium]|nr:methyltransferase domain-containing protein [Vampirovibrionales bacterium]